VSDVEAIQTIAREDKSVVAPSSPGPVRVLVADDSRVFLEAVVAVIAAADGFELVGVADSGEAAVAMAAEVDPDLVLLDVRMRGLGGAEAARRIHETNARAVLVMLTAETGWRNGVDARHAGASETLDKRFLLPATLRDVWQRYGPR
jgi:DNA-binding NarL/FixJ family response regulator